MSMLMQEALQPFLHLKRAVKSIFGHIEWKRVTFEIPLSAMETRFMLIKQHTETVGDAFACEMITL